MNRFHVALAALLVSLALNAFLAFRVVNAGITITYREASHLSAMNTLGGLEKALEAELKGLPTDQVQKKMEAVARDNPAFSLLVKREDDVLWFDAVGFSVKNGRVAALANP